MRQKKTLLILALSLFVLLLTNAYADEDFEGVNLFSFNTVYDPIAFPGLPIRQNMNIVARTDSNLYPVYFQFNTTNPVGYDPNMPKYPMTYLPQWSNLPIYPTGSIYVGGFSINSPWVNQNAVFFIDTNTNGTYDSGEPLNYILPRLPGTYNLLDAVQNVQISGGIYPTITWGPVTGADNYKVGIVGFDANGIPYPNDLKFITGFLPSDSYSYTYTGDLFKNGESYAIFVEAHDYLVYDPSNPTANQVKYSRYITEYTPVPEPSTMLLLGSGLIGLAGYGRKKSFKK